MAALFFAVSLLGAHPQARAASKAVPLAFEPPAGFRPAGPLDPADPFAAILPSGRLVVPEGTSVVVGMDALAFTLTPDGRYAIVANCDGRDDGARNTLDPRVQGGYSLSVVDVATMHLVEQYRAPGATFFAGIVAIPDPLDRTQTLVFASGGASNAVYAFDLDAAGHLTPDRVVPSIAMPPAAAPQLANAGRAFPGTLVPSKNGARIYVVNNFANTVATIDAGSRALAGRPIPVGFYPFGAARAGERLLVSNEGLASYRMLPAAVAAPAFRNVRDDRERASTLSVIPLGAEGVPQAERTSSLVLEAPPDGRQTIGGAHPAAVVATRDGRHAFVALTNLDRIAVVAFDKARPRVAGGTDLRLYDGAPYGTQPVALALALELPPTA